MIERHVVLKMLERGELDRVTSYEWLQVEPLLRSACNVILREIAKKPTGFTSEEVIRRLNGHQLCAVRAYNRAYSLWASKQYYEAPYMALQYHIQCVLRQQRCNPYLCLLCNGEPMVFSMLREQM
jgi:hypothetical protein